MNRRGFLRGLLASAAVVVATPALPQISIAPSVNHDAIMALLNERMNQVYKVLSDNIARNIFEGNDDHTLGCLQMLVSDIGADTIPQNDWAIQEYSGPITMKIWKVTGTGDNIVRELVA